MAHAQTPFDEHLSHAHFTSPGSCRLAAVANLSAESVLVFSERGGWQGLQ